MGKQNYDLIVETGKVLLEQIQAKAPSVNPTNLEGLANAYKLIVEAMPNEPREGGRMMVR